MVQKKYEIKGLKEVMSNLNREIKAIENRTTKGLIESAILIRRDMDKTPPKIPIDLGNLRASWFTVTNGKGIESQAGIRTTFKGKKAGEMKSERTEAIAEMKGVARMIKNPVLIMGFSANYAAKVHENLEKYKFHRPGSGAKFLESAVKRNTRRIIKIIQENARIKN